MNIYKNFGVLAHVDAGKTTVTEQMLYICGAVREPGRVDSGTARTDSLAVERERGISVKAACATVEYRGCTLNIIDTPGHVDFAGEVERCLAALDFAVIVVSAVEGIQSHTETILRAVGEYRLPAVVFINKVDRAGAEPDKIIASLPDFTDRFVLPLSKVTDAGSRECGVVFLPEGEYEAKLTEVLADFNDSVAESYLADRTPDKKSLEAALCRETTECKIIPVLCGSSLLGKGVRELLDFIAAVMPDSSHRGRESLSAVVYKIEHDRVMGKLAYVRLFGGEISARDSVLFHSAAENASDDSAKGIKEIREEKVSQIRAFSGARQVDTGTVEAGGVAVLCGMSTAKTGMWLGECSVSEKYKIANPFLSVKVTPPDPSKLTDTIAALRELDDEEPLLSCRFEPTEREIIISITGKVQLEIIDRLMRERFGIAAEYSPPSVIYRETPTRSGHGFEAYTMPKPCWAVVDLLIEPLPRGSGVLWDGGHVSHNKLFYKYQEHIRHSLYSAVAQGPLGWEVTDMKVTLADGEHHTIHTHPLDFFVATPMALANGLQNTGTTLLEPMLEVKITAAADCRGRIVNELIKLTRDVDISAGASNFTAAARVPAALAQELPVKAASISGGKAYFISRFDGYDVCPPDRVVTAKRRGCDPLDKPKWILYARGAMVDSI